MRKIKEVSQSCTGSHWCEMTGAHSEVGAKTAKCTADQHCPPGLPVMMEMSYSCTVHYGTTGHMWLLRTCDVSSVLKDLNF